ncbi:MAG: penicillin-binding protein [Candidatus Tectomicrobia bacterium]|nr:penicillin-binding protein [Candidatus Tectomicrobia bacterium]
MNRRATLRAQATGGRIRCGTARSLVLPLAVAMVFWFGAASAASRETPPPSDVTSSPLAREVETPAHEALRLTQLAGLNGNGKLEHRLGLDLREEYLRFDTIENGRFTLTTSEGLKLNFTLLPWLQQRLENFFHDNRNRFSFGAIVVLEPATGKVLAMVEQNRSREPQRHHLALQASYPAASLFKIITLAAALEANDSLDADSRFYYRGSQFNISRRELEQNPRYLPKHISLSRAFAKSNNPVFGAIAFRYVGPFLLKQYAQAFGFNQKLRFDYPVERSNLVIADDPLTLARIGAGLWRETTISPLHAALLAATIGNDGIMMAPYIVSSIHDANDTLLYRARPDAVGHPISGVTSGDIREMMFESVLDGTLRAAFSRNGKPLLPVQVGGKTGTLRGNDPRGKYSWFVGLAPLRKPKIAIAAMVVDPLSWRVKAHQVGREVVEAFFER